MAKAVLFDGDGVALAKQKYFSELLLEEQGIPLEKTLPFFKHEYRECQKGKMDLREVLKEKLPEWKWAGSIDEFLSYWFSKATQPDDKVLHEVQRLRNKGMKCFLATDQEKYRAEYILTALNFKDVFDRCFFSCVVGYSKSEPDYFKEVIQGIGEEPGDILYFDDEERDIEVAKSVGIDGRIYAGLENLKAI